MTTQMTTQIISEKILQLIKEDASISRKQLAEKISNITEDGIKYHLDKLKEARKIKRIGGTRGIWKILNG